MQAFGDLCHAIETAKRPIEKIELVQQWWRKTPSDRDRAWGVFFLLGGRLKRLIPNRDLKNILIDRYGVVPEVFDQVYAETGDFAGTLSSFLPHNLPDKTPLPLSVMIECYLLPLGSGEGQQGREDLILALWGQISRRDSYLVHRVLTGIFKVGISRQQVLKALSEAIPADIRRMALSLREGWIPDRGMEALYGNQAAVLSRVPQIPFHEVQPLEASTLGALGSRQDWLIEWLWQGLPVRLVWSASGIQLFDRHGEDLTTYFPEIVTAAEAVQVASPSTLEGAILVWRGDLPAERFEIHERMALGRPTPRVMMTWPVVMLCSDVLCVDGLVCEGEALEKRRARLEGVLTEDPMGRLKLSPLLPEPDWSTVLARRKAGAANGLAGILLKRRDAPYGATPWLGAENPTYRIDAVLMAAKRGGGRRSGLYTDYTMGLWKEGELIPFVTVYAGLTFAEIKEVDGYIRSHTQKKWGSERWVEPGMVFEIAFETIEPSTLYRSGLTVSRPRIRQIRSVSSSESAGTVSTLEALFNEQEIDRFPD